MRNRVLTIILAALVLVAGGYVLLAQKPYPDDSRGAGQRLFPELEQALNDVTRIRVEYRGEAYDVVREGDQWQLPDKGGYPVLFERVKPLLLGIAQLETIEPKTDQPEHYARLGVQEPAADSSSMRISLYANPDIPVASLIVGDIRRGLIAGGRDGIYARASGDPGSWLVAGNLDLPRQPVDWVDRQIIHIKPKTVKRVTVRYPDGNRLVAERSHQGAPDFTVVNRPGDALLKDGTAINPLAGGLAGLKMDDVLMRSAAGFREEDAVATIFETWDGLQVTAYTVEEQGRMFAWFDIGVAAFAATDLSGVRIPEQNGAALRLRLGGRVFQIPRSRADMLRARL